MDNPYGNSNYLCYLARVVSVKDSSDGLRIKAPIGEERLDDLDKIPYAFPLLPKMLHVQPKEGECVIIFTQKVDNLQSKRFFIGPVSPQDYTLDKAPYDLIVKGTNFEADDLTSLEAPSQNPNVNGSIPKREDVAVRGRGNTDIVLKDDELDIRCGFKAHQNDNIIEKRLEYNPTDPGFIQLKYRKSTDAKGKEFKSEINVVADRINLISHDSRTYFDVGNFPNTDPNEETTKKNEEQLAEIYKKAHALPYGDELVDFLNEFIRVFKTHTHPYHQLPPCLNESDTKAISKDLNEILSKSIRIN